MGRIENTLEENKQYVTERSSIKDAASASGFLCDARASLLTVSNGTSYDPKQILCSHDREPLLSMLQHVLPYCCCSLTVFPEIALNTMAQQQWIDSS